MKGIHVILAVVVLGAAALLFAGESGFLSSPERGGQVREGDRDVILVPMERELELTSSAFNNGGTLPVAYTCDAENGAVNPPLSFANPPEGTQSFAILVDDPDIPQVFKTARGIEKFDHWTLFNIDPATTEIAEGDAAGGVVGVNSAGDNEFRGACPPPEHEPTEHRYIFQLYALDTMLDLEEGVTQEEVRNEMKGHILEKAELIGLYDRATSTEEVPLEINEEE